MMRAGSSFLWHRCTSLYLSNKASFAQSLKLISFRESMPSRGASTHASDARRSRFNENNEYSAFPSSTTPRGTSIDPNDQAHFQRLAERWWANDSPVRPLLAMNRLRVPFIRDAYLSTLNEAESTEKRDLLTNSAQPLAGAQICDVGCGGGFLSEPLARMGAHVTGIDVVEESIIVAKAHAEEQQELSPTPEYLCMPIEQLALERREHYDVVVASEVVEHVANIEYFLDALVALTKPGGVLVITTLNRTWSSYVAAIFGAEYFFNIVPRGTHEWSKFVEPETLEQHLIQRDCTVKKKIGMLYNVFNTNWSWSSFDGVNYAISATKYKTPILRPKTV